MKLDALNAVSAADGSATRFTERKDARTVQRGAEHREDRTLCRTEVDRAQAVELSKRGTESDPGPCVLVRKWETTDRSNHILILTFTLGNTCSS